MFRPVLTGCSLVYPEGMEDGSGGPEPTLEIVDRVLIPADLPAGEYVLGWRWDCEESNQVWQSCSDVTVGKAA